MFAFVGAVFVDFISGWETVSEAAKRSTVEEVAGWDQKGSVSFCTNVITGS